MVSLNHIADFADYKVFYILETNFRTRVAESCFYGTGVCFAYGHSVYNSTC